MSNEIDSLYNDLLQAQLDKDWRKADELQRRIARIEEAEDRLPERSSRSPDPIQLRASGDSLYEVYEVEAPYARG
jgi:hypothetical protein